MNYSYCVPIVLPILAGLILLLTPEKIWKKKETLRAVVGFLMVVFALFAIGIYFGNALPAHDVVLFRIANDISIFLSVDALGQLFAGIVTVVMVLVCFFSFGYMSHEQKEKRYYAFYLITYGVLMGLVSAGNLVTMYLFYELMTVVTFPLVLHTETKEAIMASLKYLFYSFCGAYMALFGIYFLYKYADISYFQFGGTLQTDLIMAEQNTGLMLVVVFLMIMGFGVKAGMFPLHAWLPAAHPVAPAPASAVLSGIIVKGGVLAIIRVVFYVVGAGFIRGTWVQTVWLILAMITVLMGSALAYKEQIMKKRLAYSTVSNLSYIMFGLALLNPIGMTGSLLHVVFHALIKSALFLCAGAIIVTTGKTRISELSGIGKMMPCLMWCFTIASLALIGIPPTSGVVSKWYLCWGALDEHIPVIWWVGPVVLLISALLTAGYLLSISIQGFFGEGKVAAKKEPKAIMLVPIIILAACTLILGLFPMPLLRFIGQIVPIM